MKEIEVIQWVKFNKPGIKDKIQHLANKCNTKMEFLRAVREEFNLSLSDADVVVNNFFKKDL